MEKGKTGGSKSNGAHTKEQLDDYANQKNPDSEEHQKILDNRSSQLNPNNYEY